MIRLENPDKIHEMTLTQLWEMTELLEEDTQKEYEDEFRKIKFGYDIMIPITYIINEWYEEYPETKIVNVKGYGKRDILEFHDEITLRKSKLRSILQDNIEDEGYEERV